jgi:Zinc-binding dehydrogenase
VPPAAPTPHPETPRANGNNILIIISRVVVQLAKIWGLKVIGSAGRDDKVAFLRDEIGADVAFNYKTEDPYEVLAKHGPVDVFFDNTNGPQLDAALANANVGGRFVVSGVVNGCELGGWCTVTLRSVGTFTTMGDLNFIVSRYYIISDIPKMDSWYLVSTEYPLYSDAGSYGSRFVWVVQKG